MVGISLARPAGGTARGCPRAHCSVPPKGPGSSAWSEGSDLPLTGQIPALTIDTTGRASELNPHRLNEAREACMADLGLLWQTCLLSGLKTG